MKAEAVTVSRMKLEILADIMGGHVKSDIKSFSDLHNYVDANKYGGFLEEGYEPSPNFTFENECQWLINSWIRDGGLQRALKVRMGYTVRPLNEERKERIVSNQIALQREIQNAGFNVVTCGNCGDTMLHRNTDEKLECLCGMDLEMSDCPDLWS